MPANCSGGRVKSHSSTPRRGQKLIVQGNTLGKSTPKALPWAMCFWGFQPVLFDF